MKGIFSKVRASMLLAISATGLLISRQPARAQTYGTVTSSGLASSFAASTTTNVLTVIDCRANRNVGVQLGAAAIGTNTTLQVNFIRSLDGNLAHFDTANWCSMTLTVPTNTLAVVSTNLDMGAYGYLMATNATSGNNLVTNAYLQFSLKPGQ